MMQAAKHLTALVLALLVLATSALAAEGASGFSDVPDGHWAEQSIAWCARYGMMNGIGGGKFGTGREITRAEFAVTLCRMMNWGLTSPDQGSFLDNQDKSAWYYSAVETAYAHGALADESDYCRPNEALTREEMAKMIVRAMGYPVLAGILAAADAQTPQGGAEGFAGLTGKLGKNCPFTDCTTNQGYIALAYHMGVLKGVSRSSFDPKTAATREQAAAVLMRAYDRLHRNISSGEVSAVPQGCVEALPITDTSGSMPVSPRAALEEVYAAARIAGEGGSVLLRTAPLAQSVKDGKTVSAARELGSGELGALLADSVTTQHRSAKYQSSCLYHPEKDGTTTVVWYESEADLAEKVELCRLLGIKNVYLLGGAQA